MNRKNNRTTWKQIAKEITDKKNKKPVISVNQKSILDLSGIIRSNIPNAQTD